jgi:hypothetical protein
MQDKTTARIEAFLEREDKNADDAINVLYPGLPDWIPEPNLIRLRAVLKRLLSEVSIETIEEHAKAYGEDDHPPYPGIIQDVRLFIDDIGYLAHLAYAINIGETAGLKELAGRSAAHGRKISKNIQKVHEDKHGTKEEKETRWAEYQAALEDTHRKHPTWKVGACQDEVANCLGVCKKTIQRNTKKTW